MNRVYTLPMPILFVIAVIGSWCMVVLIALAVSWVARTIGALL